MRALCCAIATCNRSLTCRMQRAACTRSLLHIYMYPRCHTQFDSMGDLTSQPWHPCPDVGAMQFCRETRDRVSASVINSQLRVMFGGKKGGFVASMEHNRILCSWMDDGGTMSRTCQPPGVSETCIPGCKGMYNVGQQFCEEQAQPSYCPWGPGHLTDMVRQHLRANKAKYNEVILDGDWWVHNLPRSIEAVFFQRGGEQNARRIHHQLLSHFKLSSSEIPLVRLSLDRNSHGHQSDAPFSEAAAVG